MFQQLLAWLEPVRNRGGKSVAGVMISRDTSVAKGVEKNLALAFDYLSIKAGKVS